MNRSRTLFSMILPGLLVVALLGACSPPVPAAPRLRIQNLGAAPIKNLTVLFPEDKVYIGDVAAGATSEYRLVPKGVYGYAAYQYTENGQQVTQPVLDWMGEEPMKGSAFTYKIHYDPSRENMLKMELVEVVKEE